MRATHGVGDLQSIGSTTGRRPDGATVRRLGEVFGFDGFRKEGMSGYGQGSSRRLTIGSLGGLFLLG